ncbi:acyltransferase [Marinomonas balearica]|uniref:Acetyltransferase n=1 Tax=Marinomonas balearica TaxID=491947 RepID=A0A4R6MHN0_9GAMM|nr:acyltransferase [Marinomonas balearica]TDP01067.1 transferase family hexapeptide repeat protein [Marinomonas balearica]
MQSIQSVKYWAKTSDTSAAKSIRRLWYSCQQLEMPCIPVFTQCLLLLHNFITTFFTSLTRRIYWTPLFKSQIRGGKHLYLYSGMPQILGKPTIQVGQNCRWSGISTVSARWGSKTPRFIVGDNVDIGWQSNIAVGQDIILEDNVRMAGKAFLAGYPGHPINPTDRANGLPELDSQIGNIHLKQNVWLGTGVTVLGGVTIGRNSIIGAGSVVTKSLPDNVIAAGNPAKVIRHLTTQECNEHERAPTTNHLAEQGSLL